MTIQGNGWAPLKILSALQIIDEKLGLSKYKIFLRNITPNFRSFIWSEEYNSDVKSNPFMLINKKNKIYIPQYTTVYYERHNNKSTNTNQVTT